MCAVNKPFELLEFVFDSVYVDLQYDEIYLNFTAASVSLCCDCGRLWCVCKVVVVPYVDAVVAVSVMHVLLFVLHVCMMRECGGARLTAMLVWRNLLHHVVGMDPSTERWWRGPTSVYTHTGRWYPPI